MVKKLMYIFTFLVWTGIIFSCQDEVIVQGSDYIPEGEATINATVNFKPFGSALNGDSRTAGGAIKDIEKLYIVLFDEAGNHLETFDASGQTDYEYVESESRKDVKAGDGEHIAENATPCVTFKKTLSYGKYRIYAVANHELDLTKKYTIEELRNIDLTWDSDNVENNNQMFGYFTSEKSNSKPNGWEAPVITITSPTVSLHAWIRRAASKVTVAYDGSRLNDNVYITIKSVQIKDIPKYCKLGVDYAAQKSGDLIEEGEKIVYSSDENDGPKITRGGVTWGTTHIEGWRNPYDPKDTNGEAHKEESQAIYFYENLQGVGAENTATDKSLKRLDYTAKGKPFGTYVEVKAHYENKNTENVSSGEITYRFMLGKDVSIDYNAERNYHYKLTLCFNNDANDVDWRIDYEEQLGIYVPNPYYISYLYNQTMEMPLKVVISKDDDIEKFEAEIIENNWEPNGNTTALGEQYYGNVKEEYKARGVNGQIITGTIGNGNTQSPWTGFLSLKDEYKLNGNKIYLDGGFGTSGPTYAASAQPAKWWEDNKLGYADGYAGEVEENTGTNTKSVNFSIPFYTRVKQLYSVSGFTGNNPFVGYNRTAKVKFTVTTTKENVYTQVVTIIQVKRLVNPTGIWRDKNNKNSFKVELKEQSGYGGNFSNLISDGPWKVKMIASTDGEWFTITPNEGVTGSEVAFTYAPKSTTEKPRCGIIEVKYHNETCTHLIFVRQGYDPIAIHSNGSKWYSFNMKTSGSMATSPLDEGSLYRYGNWNEPIAEANNVKSGLRYGEAPNTAFELEGTTNKVLWAGIENSNRTTALSSPVSNTKVASLDDWKALKDGMQGYGVLYADDAGEVATAVDDAFGYRDALIDENKGKRGMRGVFAYNNDTGANVFFPIGASGHGHRKQQHTNITGVLRYGTMDGALNLSSNDGANMFRPMLYGLYAQNGAIYWTSTSGNGWDINFDQLDFNEYSYDNAWKDGKSDACFVRCVVD